MRKLFFILSLAFLFVSCEDETETGSVQWQLKTSLCPGSATEAVHSNAYLYPADNGEQYSLQSFDFNPTDLLGDPQSYPLKTGQGSAYRANTFGSSQPTTVGEFLNVKPGRYLLVVFVNEDSELKYFAFSNKYSAKYVEIKPGVNSDMNIKVLGGELTKKGFQEWELNNWKCSSN